MERLKIQANFAISPTEIMRVQRLLQEQSELLLSSEGRTSLKLLLAPLLCRNETEQEQFYQIYEDYLSKDLQLSQQEIDRQQALTDLETAKEIPQSWLKKWLPLIASLLFGLLTIGVLVYRWMNPPVHYITFEKQQKEVRVGDTLVLKNSTDTLNTPFHFHWHCLDREGKDTMHRHQDHDLTWLVPDPKGDFIKKIYLHAHHPETAEPMGVDSIEITILCNTLKVGSISVADTALIPNQLLPFSIEVENTENLQYLWQFGDGAISEEIAPDHAYTAAGSYTVQVTIRDTINTVGKCEKIVQTLIKIEPEVPDDPIVLNSFQLLEEPPIITYPLKPWYWPLLLLLLSAAAYCWWKWWHRPDPNQLAAKAQDIALKNRFAAPDKNPYSIPFAPAESKIQADKSQFEIAHSLRNRQRGNRQILDIEATLNSTVEQGGFPSVQYKYSSRPTDYLVLIDLQSAESHLARLFQYLANMLQDQDVLLDIFYYQKDFQHCWNARHPKGIDFTQLHRLYPQQRLIIMGDARALVEQVSDNQLLNPIWERQLRKWNERILLTPLPIVSWTFLEARLYRLFALFPADLLGIMQAVRFIEAGAAEEDLPTTLKEWEIQLQKSQVEEDTIRRWRTVAQHEEYLADHPDVLRWLKALVVYPNPTWNVTIAIGKALDVPITYDNLLLLARIPWLQDGNFKVRLWRNFWADLSKTDEKLARNAVKEELEAVQQQTSNAFAGRNLEQNLAIQNFALAPATAENQAVIQYLEAEDLLPKLHLEELDKVVERYIPTHRNGEETGQTLSYYLADAETKRNKKLARPIYTHHFWWGLALGLLSLLTAASYLVQGAYLHRQSIEKDISEAARLNNLAVNYMSSSQPINLNQLRGIKDTLPINGFDYKSTAALNLLQEATVLDTTFEKAHHNFQKQWYNDGISHYQEYLKDKNYALQAAKTFLKRAINYRGIKADSISHAAMYALANVYHILGETDSVCIFLDSLLKVADVPFFNKIPNLDSKAGYCRQVEVFLFVNKDLKSREVQALQELFEENNYPITISYNTGSDSGNSIYYFDNKNQFQIKTITSLLANFLNRQATSYQAFTLLLKNDGEAEDLDKRIEVWLDLSLPEPPEQIVRTSVDTPNVSNNVGTPPSEEEIIVQNEPLLRPNPVYETVSVNNFDFQALPNGQFAAISDSYISIVELFGKSGMNIIRAWKSRDGNIIAISPDSRHVVSNDVTNSNVYVWEVVSGRLVQILKGKATPIWALTYSKNNKYIVGGDRDGNIILWETTPKEGIYPFKENHIFKDHQGPINSIAMAYSGKIITGGADRTVKIRQGISTTGDPRSTIGTHNGEILSVAIDKQEKYLLTASEDKSAKLWFDQDSMLTLSGHNQIIAEAIFSPNEAFIATGGYGGVVKIWDIASGKEIQSIDYKEPITGLFFSADNQSILIGGQSGFLRKINIQNTSNSLQRDADFQQIANQLNDYLLRVKEVDAALLTIESYFPSKGEPSFVEDYNRIIQDYNNAYEVLNTQQNLHLQNVRNHGEKINELTKTFQLLFDELHYSILQPELQTLNSYLRRNNKKKAKNLGETIHERITPIISHLETQIEITLNKLGIESSATRIPNNDITDNEKTTQLPVYDFPIPQTILVQGDIFTMGCTPEQAEFCGDDEKPAHTVQVNTFKMGKYEVTNEEFVSFLNEKGNQEEGGNTWVDLAGDFNGVVCGIEQIKDQFQVKKGLEKHPMIYVSWYGAKAYCQWLKEKTGQNWRLPTEAEWEFATRGGKKSNKYIYAGSNDIEQVAWYRENSYNKREKHPDYGTHPVGQKAPNELGIYDMSGNVWEWVADCWHENYQNAPETAESWLEAAKGNCSVRVLRGGSWYFNSASMRVSFRNIKVPDDRNFNDSFRVAQD